jgi:ribosomal protein S16
LVIRFRRRGCTKYAIFDIVLIKQSKRIKGRYIEKLGSFNPQFNERMFIINSARLAY